MAHYPGYTVLRTEDCPEQHGTLTLLTHDVSGAAVLLVENEDVNKAFGIGFGTFPSDDTGVFHILEHSVLAGSEKYPVTSPFLQLLKSSMASFLNAMTFPDKTVYPFATPNETDFKNLMDVYLNAVFCPLAMVDRAVFEQEGWHRDADGTVSGVVYNEMQGALAAPDAQLENALERILTLTNDAFENSDMRLAAQVEPLEEVIDVMAERLRDQHILRLKDGVCSIDTGVVFLDVLNNAERISDHCSNVAARLIGMDAGEDYDSHTLKSIMHHNPTKDYMLEYEECRKAYLVPLEEMEA